MTKVLAVLVYPAGIAVLAVIAMLLVRRAHGLAGATAVRASARRRRHAAVTGAAAQARGEAEVAATAVRFWAVLLGGTVLVCFLTVLLGLLVVHFGPAIDKPFNSWMTAHRIHLWTAVMKRATKVGNTWTTWGSACTAAACLAVTWRSRRWLPALVLVSMAVVDKYAIIGIHQFIHRAGPPDSPLGTFPSGGASRAVIFYGLIAYLLWREFSGERRTAIWSGAAVAAIAFNEGYSRAYLTLHWLTDVVSGWFFGCLFLAVCIAAVRFAAGPARMPAALGRPALAFAPPAPPAPPASPVPPAPAGPAPAREGLR